MVDHRRWALIECGKKGEGRGTFLSSDAFTGTGQFLDEREVEGNATYRLAAEQAAKMSAENLIVDICCLLEVRGEEMIDYLIERTQ